MNFLDEWDRNGFVVLPEVFQQAEVDFLIEAVGQIGVKDGVRSRGGVYAIRNLLRLSPVIRELALSSKVLSIVNQVESSTFPVRAILFDKTAGANWLVPWHQDLTIPVREKKDLAGYGPWTLKAGIWHVQPPVSVLQKMLSLRVHLDDCSERNGALRVLPGTHQLGRLSAEQISQRQQQSCSVACVARAGDIVLMRPLLLHASSAAVDATHRRVVHVDYASSELDGGLKWAASP